MDILGKDTLDTLALVDTATLRETVDRVINGKEPSATISIRPAEDHAEGTAGKARKGVREVTVRRVAV